MQALQWVQFDFCIHISIYGMKPKTYDEAFRGFIVHLELHAKNTNKVTEPIL